MNPPSPAIVAQHAVRRLPRTALLLLCLAYVLPGFFGRDPWRTADITGFGHMWRMAQGATSWLTPQLVGTTELADALLPYWLGAGAIQWLTPMLTADAAARVPFLALLVLVLLCTWYAVYGLARSPQAQPVMFAFGGEAQPADYARAMADGGLLALLACLGLALLSHETAPALAQLACSALGFFAVVQCLRGKRWAAMVWLVAMVGLALSGAPAMAVLFGLGSAAIAATSPVTADANSPDQSGRRSPKTMSALLLAGTAAAALTAQGFELWRWRLQGLPSDWPQFKGMARLLLWFGWPATPLAAWTIWRWRHLWRSPHLALPLWFLAVSLLATLLTPSGERSLLLGLPALAALAAFALPTLSRTVTALIDWFTLLFFSGWALVVWVVWLAMQTGFPAKPAANVARLAPGYVPEFSWWALLVATGASLAWVALVRWRVGRHRAAIWKSLVLPAGGATLGWVLVMTLLLGPLDYALSNRKLVQRITDLTQAEAGCVAVRGLSAGLVTALGYHGGLETVADGSSTADHCPWLLTVPAPAPTQSPADLDTEDEAENAIDLERWAVTGEVIQGPRGGEGVQVYRRLR